MGECLVSSDVPSMSINVFHEKAMDGKSNVVLVWFVC